MDADGGCVTPGQGGRRVFGAPPMLDQGAGRMASLILGLQKEELA